MANYISEDDIEKRAIQLLLEDLDYDEHITCLTAEREDLHDSYTYGEQQIYKGIGICNSALNT
ncbi:MAG: hypothetical protein WCH34_11645 [Bacteroidota bacterium]